MAHKSYFSMSQSRSNQIPSSVPIFQWGKKHRRLIVATLIAAAADFGAILAFEHFQAPRTSYFLWLVGMLLSIGCVLIKSKTGAQEESTTTWWMVLFAIVFIAAYFHIAFVLEPAYSMRGIERGFLIGAEQVSVGRLGINCPRSSGAFYGVGVYCDHPAGTSFFQAIPVWLFGDTFLAVRAFVPAAMVLAAIPLFFLLRNLTSSASALAGTLLYLSGYYLFQWDKMAYNNLLHLPPLVLTLWALSAFAKTRETRMLFAAGLFSGLGMYFNYIGILTPFFASLFLVLDARRNTKKPSLCPSMGNVAYFLLGLFGCCAPFLYRVSEVHLSVHVPALDQTKLSLLDLFIPRYSQLSNLLGAAVYPGFPVDDTMLYNLRGHLFDFFTLAASIFGLIRILVRWKSTAPLLQTLCIVLAIYLIVLGYYNRYEYPASTRLLFYTLMLPIFATYGLDLLSVIQKTRYMALSVFSLCAVSANILMIRNYIKYWSSPALFIDAPNWFQRECLRQPIALHLITVKDNNANARTHKIRDMLCPASSVTSANIAEDSASLARELSRSRPPTFILIDEPLAKFLPLIGECLSNSKDATFISTSLTDSRRGLRLIPPGASSLDAKLPCFASPS